MNPVYVTGNPHKAKLFNEMLGIELEHLEADIDELQSLDLREVVAHKARVAYLKLKRPVIVEDTQLIFQALGKLPGPFIKWFLDEIGNEGLCKLLDNFEDRTSIAGCAIGYFDGKNLKIFERKQEGKIALYPGSGTTGFGWDKIFIPSGQEIVRADMDEVTYKRYYAMTKPFDELATFLQAIDKA